MATRKLYWADPFQTTFATIGAGMASYLGQPALVLAETLFYPEAGGQRADIGSLALQGTNLAIVDTQVDDAGVIYHLPAAEALASLALLPAGELAAAHVVGEIDSPRRREHMRQHTAQHLLSQALAQRGQRTVSSRLGASCCTIDVEPEPAANAPLTIAQAQEVAAQVYAWVLQDIEVRPLYPEPDEWQKLGLRKPPSVTEGIRVIEIDGVDRTPCGGTHVLRTAQVGYVFVASCERYKRGHRVTFHTGHRVHTEIGKREDILAELAKQFTCGLDGISAAAHKSRTSRQNLEQRVEELAAARAHSEARLCMYDARKSLSTRSQGAPAILVWVADAKHEIAYLRVLASALAAASDTTVIVLRPSAAQIASDLQASPGYTVIQRSPHENAPDVAQLWSALAAGFGGGRGGGKGVRAEGALPAAPLAGVLAPAVASLQSQLGKARELGNAERWALLELIA